jgi:ABC-type multidrug transport system fused ATPase/permease subunit
MKQAALGPPPEDGDIPVARALNPEDEAAQEPPEGPQESDREVLRWLLSYLGRHRALTVLVYTFILLSALLGFALLPVTKLLMDAVQQLENPGGLSRALEATVLGRGVLSLGLGGSPLEVVTVAAGMLLAAKLLHAVVGFTNQYLDEVLSGRILRDLREDLFAHVLALPDDYFHAHGVGALMTRFSQDLNGAVAVYAMVFFGPVVDLVLLVVSSVYLVQLDPLLGGLALLTAPVYYLVSGPLAKRIQARVAGLSAEFAAVNDDLQETLSAVREVKAHGAEARERAEFRGRLDSHFGATLAFRRWSLLGGQATKFISEAAPVVLLAFGSLLIVRYHTVTLGTLIVVYGSVGGVIAAMSSLSNVGLGYKGALTYARQVRRVFTAEREAARFTGTRTLAVPSAPDVGTPALAFEHVSMVYPGTGYRVTDLTFKVLPGQTVAIVGEGGAGKSTVFNLLFKLYPYAQGSVKVFGQELRELDIPSVRRAFGFLQQFPFFFQRSFRENLLYGTGASAADKDTARRLDALCAEFGLDEVAGAMNQGFESTITNRGANLSGSQQKRTALVRALLKDPPFLLLDEPLSGLSPEQRRDVVARLRALAGRKTVLVITHDLDLVKELDWILVFQRQELPVAQGLPAGVGSALGVGSAEPPPGVAVVAGGVGRADPDDATPERATPQELPPDLERPAHGVLVEQGTYAELAAHGTVFRQLLDAH